MKDLNNKTINKLIIFFLIFVTTILCCGYYSVVEAKNYTNMQTLKGAAVDGKLAVGDTYTAESESKVFTNDEVFCVQSGQNYKSIDSSSAKITYTLKRVIKVDDSINEIYSPILYIKYYYPKSRITYDKSVMPYFNKSPQIAIWQYIKKYSNKLTGYFCVENAMIVDKNNNKKYYTKGGTLINVEKPYIKIQSGQSSSDMYGRLGKTSMKTYSGKSLPLKTSATNAYTIYQDAVKNGNSMKGTIYVFNSSKSQNFILIEDDGPIIEPEDIKITLYKEDKDSSEGIEGAKFKVKKIEGGKIVTNGLGESVNTGLLGTLKIKPDDINGTIKVTLEEEEKPDGYLKLDDDIVITIKLTNNVITSIITTPTKYTNSKIVSVKKAEVDIKNEQTPGGLKIRIQKNSASGAGVKDCKFQVEFWQDNLKKETKYIDMTDGGTFEGKTYGVTSEFNTEIKTPITVKITETETNSNYWGMNGTVEITFEYDSKSNSWLPKAEGAIKDTGNNLLQFDNEDDNPQYFSDNKIKKINSKTFAVKIKNDKKIITNLQVKKVAKGNETKNLYGAEFTLCFKNAEYVIIDGSTYKANKNNEIKIEKVSTNTDGVIEIDKIVGDNTAKSSKKIYFTIEETNSPNEYALLSGKGQFVLEYENGDWDIHEKTKVRYPKEEPFNELKSTEFEINNENNICLTLKDDLKIDKLTILKTDSQSSSTKLQGAKFNITLSNIKSAKGYSANASGKIILNGVTTDPNGNIVLEDLVISNIDNPITITIEEKQAPIGYKKLEGIIIVTLTRSGSTYKVSATKSGAISDNEFKTDNVKIENNQVVLNINNIPVMNLGGIAWEDGQTGEKAPKPTDGKIGAGEPRLSGIQVTLYKEGESNPITKDIYGNDLMTKTASAGEKLTYKMCNGQTDTITLEEGEYIFPNLEKGANYYVVFTYDGINYQTTKLSGDLYKYNNESKVTEVNRDTFNAKFKTISDSTTKDTNTNSYAKANGVSEDLVYSYADEENEVKISKLITTDSEGNVLGNYKMTAKTANYLKTVADWKATWTNDGKINRNHYALDINCGLVEKFFDLSLESSENQIRYTINGKELIENLNDAKVNRSEMSPSDYYYRYDSMTTDKDFANKEEAIERNKYLKEDTELEVYVTYKLIVSNQSTYNATVNEIKYDYSPEQLLESVKLASGEEVNYSINGNNSIIIKPKQTLTNQNNVQEIFITFKLAKDESTRSLPKAIETVEGLTCENTAEIISYSTEQGGLIDNDSAPGNYLDNRKKENDIREDDETYTSQNFRLKEIGREINGNVAEADSEGNLINSKNINDVIVQLVEVFKNAGTGNYVEYIWQETRTGSNIVKARDMDGTLYEYTNKLDTNEENRVGKYQFLGYMAEDGNNKGVQVGFIPGDYIVRYIYGDGTTYDNSITGFTTKYNGQNYKSANDAKYKEKWYVPQEKSSARDNEARRLEVMAFSTNIDGGIGTALDVFARNVSFNNLTSSEKTLINNYYKELSGITETKEKGYINYIFEGDMTKDHEFKDELDVEEYNKLIKYISYKTWMCADTSMIEVKIDTEKFGSVNFGLVERPKTKLVLEKHITGLKITPTGTGVQPIVDARANISQILNNPEIEKKGITTELSAMKASRDNRNFWKVETAIDELAQGATLEVEYTYVIKDESDVDYLSDTLITAYKNQDTKPYSEVLNEICETIKGTMRSGQYSYSDTDKNKIGTYLGQFYYTGTQNETTDALVSSRVDTIEDYLENQLKLSEILSDNKTETDFKKSNTGNVTKNVYDIEGYKKDLEIETVIQNKRAFNFTVSEGGDETKNTDYTKTVLLTTTLSASNKEGIILPGYIAQIMKYSNAAGRKDMDACPENLSYIHSEDNRLTLDSYVKYDEEGNISDIYMDNGGEKDAKAKGFVRLNEHDEFWIETTKVTKDTGENKQEPLQIAIIAISSIAVLGVGIILIKKFVLKK